MTRAELVTMIVSYSKRADLSAQIIEYFIPLAEARIGRDLKAAENEAALLMQPVASPFDLPDDYGQIRALWSAQSRGPLTLVSLDLHTINHWNQSGGDPRVYNIANGQIDVRPYAGGDFTLYYFTRPELASDTATNGILDRWPQLYLYGSLVELNIWAQDAVQRDLALSAYNGEVVTINRDAERARGDKPAMRRA